MNSISFPKQHDTRYEWKAVSLLAIGMGLISLDRWIIATLFPFMAKDLSLSYASLGNLVGVFGIAWGFASILMGRLSDHVGWRKVLIISTAGFSLLSSFSGLAGGIASLLLIRVVMGASEGAYMPASMAATNAASLESRRGLNQGLLLSTFALFGLGFAPIIVTQLMRVLPSWRYVFFLSALPGLLVAAGLYLVIRDHPKPAQPAHDSSVAQPVQGRWIEVFRSRNVVLSVLGILCAMACIFVLGAMIPSYIIDYLHLSPTQMGWIVSAVGFGGFLGEFSVSGVSDHIGRRAAAQIAFVCSAIAMYAFTRVGANPALLFVTLFVISFFSLGLLALFTGPVPTEGAPVGLIASSVGLVSGMGEIFGGGIAPAIAGHIAQHYGIRSTLYFALGGIIAGFFVSLFLKESAPRHLARKSRAGTQ
jgi:predicted MFS family arabinose efflux permease